MPFNPKTDVQPRAWLTLIALASITALIFIPTYFRSSASSVKKGLLSSLRTESSDPDLPNYDIRRDKSALGKLATLRGGMNKNAVQVADLRDQFVAGEKELASRVPSLKVEYNSDLHIPEVIATDVRQGKAFLSAASSEKHSDVLRDFLRQNATLTGVASAQVDQLKVFSDYTNPNGNLSFVEIDQEINGIPVFRGEVKAAFTKRGEMARIINNLAPGLDYASLSTDFRDPLDAVNAAAGFINHKVTPGENSLNSAASTDLKAVFGSGDWPITAEKMYFPTEPGVAVPAWRVAIKQSVNGYYVIVDAETGSLLWRKNVTADQTQQATYNVYTSDSPGPLSPTNSLPGLGIQGASVGRVDVTVIGNEAPNPGQDNLGWITDGNNTTEGNNVKAGVDLGPPDGVDATVVGNPNRVFSFAYNPPPGGADAPSGASYRNGVVTNLFYWTNRYHDILYSFGFTESARNFQNNNFARGGVSGDAISAEAQDSSGTNNANFSTFADGIPGQMQMYIFTGPTPDRDGSLDADVFLHEMTHGLSNRLVGNGSGLNSTRGAGMGEGWSDFYGRAILSTADEDVNGIYAMGGYVTRSFLTVGTDNYYYGIRRFPYAVKTNVGANGKPHNPLTLADIDPSQISTTDGAFPKSAWVNNIADEVHNEGEVWCMMLLEVRARIINRMGFAAGNARSLQIVTDGLKLTPLSPDFVQARDAIIAADVAGFGGADVADIWAGFATRGNGFTAVDDGSAVTESFDLPNLLQTPTFTVSDAAGNNNGFPEPGENLTLTIPLSNITGSTATGVTLQIVGGGNANYGTINNASSGSQQVSFTVPQGTQCGSVVNLTFNVNSSLGATSFNRTIIVGIPSASLTQNFDGVTAPAIPAGWTATSVLGGINFVTVTTNRDTLPNSAYGVDPSNSAGETDLTSPPIAITSGAATVSFRNRYDTEAGWDGGILEVSIAGGPFTDVISAGGAFISNGYNGVMTLVSPTPPGYTPNPLAGRSGWTGNSNGFITTVVRLPAAAAGQNIQLRWRVGADDNTAGAGPNPGVYIDTVQVFGSYSCSFVSSVKSRGDFDGDGKTDLSVFRPGDGNWYAYKSGDGGVQIVNWGVATDKPVPGDYDHDGKADVAVFRPATGQWFVLRSSDSTIDSVSWGAVGDVPVAGDYDGDGKTDVAVYRNGAWLAFQSTAGVLIANWGVASDKPVQADYDGDNKDDIAVYRPSDGTWYVFRSSDNSVSITTWGNATDVPIPGDYDGDGKTDVAVFREGSWFAYQSTAGVLIANWGTTGDIPIPARYIP